MTQQSICGLKGKTYETACQLKELNAQKSADSRRNTKGLVNQVMQNLHTTQWNFLKKRAYDLCIFFSISTTDYGC